MDFLLGTFNTKTIYTFRFTPPSASHPASLAILHKSPALGSHSWLSLSPPASSSTHTKQHVYLYATAWTTPPSIAAYSIDPQTHTVRLINNHPVRATSGYVCASRTHIYSAGGPTGEVFTIDPATGGIGELVQELSFVDAPTQSAGSKKSGGDAHGDFGGLRHGAHSVDLSPDGKMLYIADIGRNCVWVYHVTDQTGEGHLKLARKHVSPRAHDGPRHAWPHPNGRVVYSLQEHSSMVDAFFIHHSSGDEDGEVTLQHTHGVGIIPESETCKDYWADEVRLSPGPNPRYLYASTRGLKAETKGWVAVYALDEQGGIGQQLAMWQTPTSGGIANAIEPAPRLDGGEDEVEYAALTDTEEGLVMVLGFDGQELQEVARWKLMPEEGDGVDVVKAATAVWL